MHKPDPIKLEKNKRFLKNQLDLSIELSAPEDPALQEALAGNVKPAHDVELGKVAARASGGIPAIEFGGDAKGSVSFSGAASLLSAFGIYLDRDRMLAALQLDPQQNLQSTLASLPNDASGYYAVLRWGYDLSAKGTGSMALGAAGSVKFGGEAGREGLYAVVRRFPAEAGMLTAAAQTANSWMLPRQVASSDDLEPGTWILAEVNSGVSFKLNGILGYNFNWLRKLKAGTVGGDIGLKLHLGLETVVGLFASGRYALVVARETDEPVIRLRLYKLRRKGWDFALNAGAAVETVAALPQNVDDLIKAAFGVHGAQIMEDLQAIERWTDPKNKPSHILAGLSEDYCLKLLERLAGIPVVNQGLAAFNQAREQAMAALRKWSELDAQAHGVATKILKMLESENVDLTPVQELAKAIANSDRDACKRLLSQQLERSDFFQSNEGKWLESALATGILNTLNNPYFDDLRRTARITSEILEGRAAISVLKKLQDYVNDALNLEQIKSAIEAADISHLEAWLKVKLEEFLAKDVDIPALKEIQAAIDHLLEYRKEIYAQARSALNRKHEFELQSTYKQATVDTALVDLEFDSRVPGAAPVLADALGGDFNHIFLRPTSGVRLHAGVLSHGITRESRIEVSLPYFDAQTDHINESVARFSAEESEGKVYVLDTKDRVTDRNKRVSMLSVGAYLPVSESNSIRRHSSESVTYSYSYREAIRGMQTAHLRYLLAPYISTYFKSAFGTAGGSYEVWIDDLDRTLDARGTHQIGNTLVSLELCLPGEITGAWFNAQEDSKAVQYMFMSKQLQRAIKRMLPFYYLQDLDNYRNINSVYALLVYSAIPPLNAVSLKDGQIVDLASDFYWDWVDSELRKKVVSSVDTQRNLFALLAQIHRLLEATGLKSSDYEPDSIVVGNILRSVMSPNPGFHLLQGLLKFEADVIRGAVAAGTKLAKFVRSSGTNVTEAIETLAEFGAAAAGTFNKELSSIYGGGPSRPLSTMLFIEAAGALEGRVRPEIYAMLGLTIFTDTAAFPNGYLAGEAPKKEDILITQRLLNFASL